MVEFVPIDHPRFRKAQHDIFTRKLAPDCMSFTCKLTQQGRRTVLDACCQYGSDVGIGERDGILQHRAQIRALLDDDAKDRIWFTDEQRPDPDFPGGAFVRANTHGQGCLFLAHDQRGCAIHRASIEGGWSLCGIKPHVCRLFPLSYVPNAIVLSDDYDDYSCAFDTEAPSVYRVQRDTLLDVFGGALVAALDAAEALVTATPILVSPQRLVSRTP